MIDLSNPDVARYFSAGVNGAWNCTNGYIIGGAILAFYKDFGGKALCGLSHLGLPLSNEIGIGGNCVIQRFERGVLCFDPQRNIDHPPGLDPAVQVYTAHIDSAPGQDPRIAQLQKQVTDLQAQIAALQAQLAGNTLAQEVAALQTKIAQAVKDLS